MAISWPELIRSSTRNFWINASDLLGRLEGGREGGGTARTDSFSRINYKPIVSFIINQEKFKLKARAAPEDSAMKSWLRSEICLLWIILAGPYHALLLWWWWGFYTYKISIYSACCTLYYLVPEVSSPLLLPYKPAITSLHYH